VADFLMGDLFMFSVVILSSFFASILTFYSGFGLGTLLSAILFIYFDIEIAIGITAIVHLLNNIFKLTLVYENIDVNVLKKFGLLSIVGSFIGSLLLNFCGEGIVIHEYLFFDKKCFVTSTKILMATVMMIFVFIELTSSKIIEKWFGDKLNLGGILSGFFGGLSGHQGALRSLFLIKYNLEKQSFIATGVGIACLVDITRLISYSTTLKYKIIEQNLLLITLACLAAFMGAYLGNNLLKKTTIKFVQKNITILMFVIAILMIFGIL
jgi:uncharacterized protein